MRLSHLFAAASMLSAAQLGAAQGATVRCNSTAKVDLNEGAPQLEGWANGRLKEKGGDEYYVFAGAGAEPYAVAHVGDTNNGYYPLRWVSLRPFDGQSLPIVVILESSCNRGSMPPPPIAHRRGIQQWGFEGRRLPPHAAVASKAWPTPPLPPIQTFRSIVGVGGSLLQQLMLKDGLHARVGGARWARVSAGLPPEHLEASYLKPIRTLVRSSPPPSLLMLNGGVWNVLGRKVDPELKTFEAALGTLLRPVQTEFPSLTIAWAGVAAMHYHRAT